MNIIHRFKSLPLSSKRLMSLGLVLGLFVALPLFIWAVATQTFLFKQRAATGEPVPIPTPQGNAINWSTSYASLSASNFYLRIDNSKVFVAPTVTVHSDPGDDEYTTLEMTWRENNINMSITFYFKMVNGNWMVTEARSGDGTANGQTLYYYATLGAQKDSVFLADNLNLVSSDQRGFMHFENFRLQAFPRLNLPISIEGYILEPKPYPSTITLNGINSNYGYGVNVVLRNNDYSVVTDQSNINYQWTTTNASVVTVTSSNIEITNPDQTKSCAFGIQLPCPNNHGDLRAIGAGEAVINVKAVNKLTGAIMASTFFSVTVNPNPSPTPYCIPRPSCLDAINRCLIPEPYEGWCQPSPMPTASVMPSIVPSPTPGPALRIITESFIDGFVGDQYRNFFYGEGLVSTADPILSLTATNLPEGFSIPPALCGTSYPEGNYKRIECALDGMPTVTGIFEITIHLSDNLGNSITKTVPLKIRPALTSPTPSPVPEPWDVNGDGRTNIIDIGIIVDNYKLSPPNDPAADVNKDGIVNIIDIGIIVDHYQFN